jgi:hypothetical protein
VYGDGDFEYQAPAVAFFAPITASVPLAPVVNVTPSFFLPESPSGVTGVPEPGSIFLLGSALTAVAAFRKRLFQA